MLTESWHSANMEIGSKLKRLRIKNNLTQEELADRCELSKGFISQIERDLASPSISTQAVAGWLVLKTIW